MRIKRRLILAVGGAALMTVLFLFMAPGASAHEAYVLTARQFDAGLNVFAKNPFAPLVDPAHLETFLWTALAVLVSYILVFLWSASKPAEILDRIVRKAKVAGPLIIRTAISASFIYAAMSNAILGPELSLSLVPYGIVIRFLLFLVGFMVLFGVLIELAALIALAMFVYVTFTFGVYMATYANYFGEIIVLLLFGSRYLSFDRWILGKDLWVKKLERFKWLETPIVRILYGVALLYAGYTIKFLHQQLTVDVYNEYHLVNFFHATAAYIAAGAGVAEMLIGLFIILGFAMRWTVIISLIFITLSILYFRELLWPHLMLYGISFSLLINSGDRWTLDARIVPRIRRLLKRKQLPASAN
ncbi:hypothetical protein M1413_03330 [Patescibacteria group bacterium]|nr:hypothetical protein [Patescibacteria group bacterium]MCL5114224.1 hypothetical protein [Patescibacteria group bacterium]